MTDKQNAPCYLEVKVPDGTDPEYAKQFFQKLLEFLARDNIPEINPKLRKDILKYFPIASEDFKTFASTIGIRRINHLSLLLHREVIKDSIIDFWNTELLGRDNGQMISLLIQKAIEDGKVTIGSDFGEIEYEFIIRRRGNK